MKFIIGVLASVLFMVLLLVYWVVALIHLPLAWAVYLLEDCIMWPVWCADILTGDTKLSYEEYISDG